MELTKELSVVEVAKLENAECCISDNIESVRRAGDIVGRALAMIRDERLYRDVFTTFEEYCQARWGFTRQRASQLIGFASVVDDCQQIVDTKSMHEGHARELAKIKPEERAEAWQEAVSESNGTPTAKDVEAVVDRRKPTVAKPEADADTLNDIEEESGYIFDAIEERWRNTPLPKPEFRKAVYQAASRVKSLK